MHGPRRPRSAQTEVEGGRKKVEGVGRVHLDLQEVPRLKPRTRVDVDFSIDLRRVRPGARHGHAVGANLVDQNLKGAAHLLAQLRPADLRRSGHETFAAILLHHLIHMAGQGLRGRPGHVFVCEAAHAVELGLLKPVQKDVEIRLRLPRKSHNEG